MTKNYDRASEKLISNDMSKIEGMYKTQYKNLRIIKIARGYQGSKYECSLP